MNTIILMIASLNVENVSDTTIDVKNEVADYVGRRHIVENNTGLPSLCLNCLLESEDKSKIMEIGAKHNMGLIFVESEYNVLHGSTLKA